MSYDSGLPCTKSYDSLIMWSHLNSWEKNNVISPINMDNQVDRGVAYDMRSQLKQTSPLASSLLYSYNFIYT